MAEIGEDTQAYCDEPMNGEPLCQQRVGNVLDALLDDDCEATQVYREFPDEKEAEKGSQQEDLGTAVPESSGGFQCADPSTDCVAAAHADGSSEAMRPYDAQIALGQNNGVNNPEESFLDGSAPDDASQDTQVDLDEPERMSDFESVEQSRPAGDGHDTSDDVQKTQVYREFPDEKDAEEESQQEDLGTAVPESSGGFQCGDPSTECVAAAHADGSSQAMRPHDAQIALGQNNGVNNPEESFLDGSAPDDASQDTQVDLDEPERMSDFESVEQSRPAGDGHDTSDDVQKTQVYNEFPDEKDGEEESQQEDLGTAVPESSGGFQCGDPSTECVAAAHADGSSEAMRPYDAQIALGQNNGVNNPEESFLDGSAPDDASQDTQVELDEPERMSDFESVEQSRPAGDGHDTSDDVQKTQVYREFPDEKEAEEESQQEDLGTAVPESSGGFQCGDPSTECVAAAHADGSSQAMRPHDAQIALGQNNGVNNPEESFLDGSAPDDASQDTQVDLDEPERMSDFESVEQSRPAGDGHDTSDDVQKTQVYNEFPDEKDAEEESQQEDLGTAVPESSSGFQCGDPSAECVAESQDVELPRVVLDMFSAQSAESGEVSADGDWFVLCHIFIFFCHFGTFSRGYFDRPKKRAEHQEVVPNAVRIQSTRD